MIPCTVVYHDDAGNLLDVATVTPGLPPLGTRFEFHDSDLGYTLAGIVTHVVCAEDDGDFTITIHTREPRNDE